MKNLDKINYIGIGTELASSLSEPNLGMVYKLTSLNEKGKMKVILALIQDFSNL